MGSFEISRKKRMKKASLAKHPPCQCNLVGIYYYRYTLMSDESILILLKLALIFLVKFTDPIISQICIAVTLHFTLLSANK